MHNPPHPGEVIRSTLLDANNVSVTQAAEMLGVSRTSMSKLMNCHSGISPEMAVRLSLALSTSSEMWLNLQTNYDLWMAEKSRKKLAKQVYNIHSYL